MYRIKPISTSLSPNTQKEDVLLALKLLVQPTRWTRGKAVGDLENKFKEYLGARYSYGVNSGRSALFLILKSLGIGGGDEVLLQAFTCNAVPNPVLWTGATPVYVDIDESLNIDPADLEKKITARSRAIIVQHTFGIPAKLDTILDIARRHRLTLIEDCAHALGAEYNRKKLGTFGDVSFFSFGRDKVISSVWGGMITTDDAEIAEKIEPIYQNLPHMSLFWTVKQLLHPFLFSIIIPTYYILGKYFLALLRCVRGVTLAVSQEERLGEQPGIFPAKMPNALAVLALKQFGKLGKYNEHRRMVASFYYKNLRSVGIPAEIPGAIYLRFNILHPKAKAIIKEAKKSRILLGDWYRGTIAPTGTDFEKIGYVEGNCPRAESAASESINLPTHINMSIEDAENIVAVFKKNASQ